MQRFACSRLLSLSRRRFASNKRSPLTYPLNEPLPSFEHSLGDSTVKPSTSVNGQTDPFATELSTLKSGLRVASAPSHGDFVTVGVAIQSGCRFEAEHAKGVSRFIEKLAFGSTSRRDSNEIFSALDKSSAIIDCQSGRDLTIYAASCHRSGLPEILEIIADAAINPLLLEDEIEACAETIVHENDDMRIRIENEPLMTDWLHQAAYRNNTLGFSKFCTDDAAWKMTEEDVERFQRAAHVPKRMVVAGVGVEHAELVGLSERCFQENTSELPEGMKKLDESTAQYTGGEVREVEDLSEVGAGTPYPLLDHLAVGFEGVGYKDEDFVAFSVLQALMGGGNSFSAGGPGKGMYTRMYTDVLNHHHWMYGCQAFHHAYADTGLFTVHAACPPDGIGHTLCIVLDQFLRLPQGADKVELERAKTQLKSQLLMNLEVRPVQFEDIVRQVTGHGYRKKPVEYMEKIDSIQSKDIARVGERLLSSRPSLVGYGKLANLQSYDQLDEAIARRDVGIINPSKKRKIFSWQ